jgi:hypothetical protein
LKTQGENNMMIKKSNFYLLIFMLMTIFGVTSISYAKSSSTESSSEKTSIQDVQRETQEFLQALGNYTANQRDEAIRETKIALDSLDQQIDVLEMRIDNNWEQMNKAAREQARSSLKALREQRIQVAEWYGSLKSSSTDAWEHTKQGFSEAYNALYESWKKSQQEFSADQ